MSSDASDLWSSVFLQNTTRNNNNNPTFSERKRPVLPPRPSDNDPLLVITWLLESKSTDNCSVKVPRARFELQSYEFYPVLPKPVKFHIVSLVMDRFSQRFLQPGHQSEQTYSADCEVRLTVIRHVLREMIRLHRWHALMVFRVNDELHPSLDQFYSQSLQNELAKLQVKSIFIEPKHKSLQIILQPPTNL
jgi:hypothetical protein